jgi:hypothetical protein
LLVSAGGASDGVSSSAFSLELLGEIIRCFRLGAEIAAISSFSTPSFATRFPFVFSSRRALPCRGRYIGDRPYEGRNMPLYIEGDQAGAMLYGGSSLDVAALLYDSWFSFAVETHEEELPVIFIGE